MNYGIILNTLGWVMNIEALCMTLPLLCAFVYKESIIPFAVAIGICLAFGLPFVIKSPKNKTFYSKEGFITVALSWIVISFLGAVPFVVSGYIPDFVDAFFETVSGFTTTGASILSDVEALPKSLIFWRSFTHWIGGMGVLVFLVALLPLSGGSNMYLLKAESPGPSVSKLVPKVKSTAKILYVIYIAMTFIQIILLLLGGMDLFDSLTLTFGTAGTGGFGITNSGFADYSSYVQIVCTVFMILFGIDFSVYYLIIMRRFREAFRSSEVRTYLTIIFVSVILITSNCMSLYSSIGEALKHSAFQVGSIITTTGYSSVDFNLWPEFSKTILVILMFIGACAGSTGGGMKVSRMIILVKSIVKEAKIAVHPRATHKITMNGRLVAHETIRATNVFMVSYFIIFFLSLLIISIDNMSFTTNFTAVAATINNIGPGLDMVGPTSNFGAYSPFSKLVLSFNMLLGRLEIFPLLTLFSPFTWRK